MLKIWGEFRGFTYSVNFHFKWGRSEWGFETVSVLCADRAAVARCLRKYRRARRAVGSLGHTSYVKASRFPRFGFRWLACRWCTIEIFGNRGQFVWGLTVPPGGFIRRNFVGVRPRPRTLWDLLDWTHGLWEARA